ncbi:hypothetical protein EI982_17510 [Haloplanus rallus]|uniref:Uncharacterized protein n=1 Tax=Haloplanus rallus TaxID=1816183 RepID=A0A6B9FGA1_9EURY|nr:hypothetical protein [Haloplanus rallus]QGX96450.1 hypothetical protein EI982_17510 [Haloplanus rallus]
MASAERLTLALVVAGVPTAVALVLTPPNRYAWLVVGVGTLLGCLPAAYLVVGTVASDRSVARR